MMICVPRWHRSCIFVKALHAFFPHVLVLCCFDKVGEEEEKGKYKEKNKRKERESKNRKMKNN